MKRNFTLEIDGRILPVEIEQDKNKMSITLGGRTFEVAVERKGSTAAVEQDGNLSHVTVRKINSRLFETEMFGEAHRVSIEESVSELPTGEGVKFDRLLELQGGDFIIKTSMPGTIVSIDVEPGEEVRKGDGICVVEAMKLHNRIASPYDGTVKEIKAAAGTAVMPGEPIVVLTPKKTEE